MKLEVCGGCFSFAHSDRTVLDDVNFSTESGSIMAVLGPNGAGKTTMMRCMMNLISWKNGCTLIDGRDLRTFPARELWQIIAYVPQARQVVSAYTVEEMVLLGRTSRIGRFSVPGRRDLEKADEIIEKLNLNKIRSSRCDRISGGELQMVLIARALAAEPQILVLDEPESNLDFKNQLLVLDVMTGLASDSGLMCIFNTHYPSHALRRADKAFMLAPGGKWVFGPAGAVVTEENIGRFFGVQAVIGEIETDGNIFQDVFPVAQEYSGNGKADNPSGSVIASVSIIMPNRSNTDRINRIIHEYSSLIIGRMGMPYKEGKVYIINLMLDASVLQIRNLTNSLNLLPEISVKAVYSKGF